MSYLVKSCSDCFIKIYLIQSSVKMLLVGSGISIEVSHALLVRFVLAFMAALGRNKFSIFSDITFLLSIMLSRYVFEDAESGNLRVDVHVAEFRLLNSLYLQMIFRDHVVVHFHFLLIFLHAHADRVPQDVPVDNLGFCKSQ